MYLMVVSNGGGSSRGSVGIINFSDGDSEDGSDRSVIVR